MNNKVEGPETFGQPNLPVAMAPAFFLCSKMKRPGSWAAKQQGRVVNYSTSYICWNRSTVHLIDSFLLKKIFSLFNDTFNDY